jgi:hypothetical protein
VSDRILCSLPGGQPQDGTPPRVGSEPRHLRRRPFYLRLLLLLALSAIHAPLVEFKKPVIFEQIGKLTGVAAYLYVHIELSISSIEQQLSKYRQLLLTKLGNEVSIYQFLMGTDDPAVYRERMGTNGANSKTVDATVPWAIKVNTQLRKKVVKLHLHDVDDIDHHVSSLRNALPRMPSSNEDQIHLNPPVHRSPNFQPGASLYTSLSRHS